MDPRTIEINSLRVLNDYLNQTIDALIRTQRAGVVGALDATGLTHSPYTTTAFGTPQSIVPNYLSHTPFATSASVPFVPGFATTPFATDAVMLNPFLAQRMLAHSTATTLGSLATRGPLADIARQWDTARQWDVLPIQRAWGVPF